ncbi:MAG: caspase family protein [Nitrospirae bacterium]|nr:caspase family protein [Nitrospirota bacterium]MBF0542231.1 caspase family protein [Nitrospirota bacterium]
MNKFTSLHILFLTTLILLCTNLSEAVDSLPPTTTTNSTNNTIKAMQTEKRVALVIGNGAYKTSPLKNPVNDALAMAKVLESLNFEVISGVNLTKDEMMKRVIAFGNKIKDGGVGLFYFAGHGVAFNGQNYLIPINATIDSQEVVEVEAMSADYVLARMDAAKNRLNIVILDACRNNPFARSFRSVSNGLAQMKAPEGSFIAYATAPGSVASDGGGKNGLYTQELIKSMNKPGLKIEEMFKDVRISVESQSGKKQTPWESSSITGDFYFKIDPNAGSSISQTQTVQTVQKSLSPIEEHWQTIKNSTDISDFRDFITAHPNSSFVAAAQAKIKQLEKIQQKPKAVEIVKTPEPVKPQKTISNDNNVKTNVDTPTNKQNSSQNVEYVTIKSGTVIAKTSPQTVQPINETTYERAPSYKNDDEIRDSNDTYNEGITDAASQYSRGVLAEFHHEYNKAFKWFKLSADQGNAGAIFRLGKLYQDGLGVKKNLSKAISLFVESCKSGNADAINNLYDIQNESPNNSISRAASLAIDQCQYYSKDSEQDSIPQGQNSYPQKQNYYPQGQNTNPQVQNPNPQNAIIVGQPIYVQPAQTYQQHGRQGNQYNKEQYEQRKQEYLNKLQQRQQRRDNYVKEAQLHQQRPQQSLQNEVRQRPQQVQQNFDKQRPLQGQHYQMKIEKNIK